jgi:L-seryl-tRNA(Ser) seleniumtransferase
MTIRETRRGFLTSAAAATATTAAAGRRAGAAPSPNGRSIYLDKLGLRPVINGVGTVTILGGSIMPPEVVEAMVEAARHFVPMNDLHDKVGARIAELLRVPAAMVSCGAASSITCAAAACLAGGDPKKVAQLPDTTGLRNEIIQQKTHLSGYEGSMLLTGAKIVSVETREELERAIGERTAMMFYLNKAEPDGRIKRAEWVAVAKARGVPTFNDAAADVPPPERLTSYVVADGFDLVGFSGGKGLLGPQASGLLLGRKDLIAAARLAISPYGGIGRSMKVGKEEMVGLLVALERYLRTDHAAERRRLDARADHVLKVLAGLPRVAVTRHVPEIANRVPHVQLKWDENAFGRTAQQVVDALRTGNPPIEVRRVGPGELLVSMWMLQGDEHRIVARRLREVLS